MREVTEKLLWCLMTPDIFTEKNFNMWQVVSCGIRFAPCHTKQLAELCAKQFISAKVERTKFFIQPTFTLQHEIELLKLNVRP